jgi:hypothetical protein
LLVGRIGWLLTFRVVVGHNGGNHTLAHNHYEGVGRA